MRVVAIVLWLVGCGDPDGGDTDGGSGDSGQDSGGDSGDDSGVVESQDADGDGYAGCDYEGCDCDDTREDVNPGVEGDVCNGRDDNCDGDVDETPDLAWYPDLDGDGFGEEGSTSFDECPALGEQTIPGYASNDADCDDSLAEIFPGADEVCDEVDNDCDDETDEDESTWSAFYADVDGDGAGSPDAYVYGCYLPVDGAENTYDCDDADADEPVFADPAGSARGTGTLASPLRSLQGAVNAAHTCVVALGGTYSEDIDFGGNSVAVVGVEGSETTIVEGTGGGPVLTAMYGETVSVTGLTLRGGAGYELSSSSSYWDGTQYIDYEYVDWYGGGLYAVSSTVTLDDVVIEENGVEYTCAWVTTTSYYCEQSYGGGVWGSSATLDFTDVSIRDNVGTYGTAMYLSYSELAGERLFVGGNTGQSYTMYLDGSRFTADALILDSNTSDTGSSGIYAYNTAISIQNATLLGSTFGIYAEYCDVILDSSVIGGADYGLVDPSSTTTWALTFNDVYGSSYQDYYGVRDPTGTDGNLSVAPSFVTWSNDDDWTNNVLTLRTTSTLVDAGNTDEDRYDVDGTRCDIGAYGGPNGSW